MKVIDNITDDVLCDEQCDKKDTGADYTKTPGLDESTVRFYYYDNMTEPEKQLYEYLYANIKDLNETVSIPDGVPTDTVNGVLKKILFDHPDIYWISKYQFTVSMGQSTKLQTQVISKETKDDIDQKLAMRIDEIMERLDPTSDYTYAKSAYEDIITHIKYESTGVENDQNIISAVLDKKTVCAGASKLFQLLMQKRGIECAVIPGATMDGTPHMWNLVKLDGFYYYTDVTYGMTNSTEEGFNYDLLNVTSDEINAIYQFESDEYKRNCLATKDNYYAHVGRIYNCTDKDALKEQIAEGFPIYIKCTGDNCYKTIKKYLLEDRHIKDYTDANVEYTTSDSRRIIIIKEKESEDDATG